MKPGKSSARVKLNLVGTVGLFVAALVLLLPSVARAPQAATPKRILVLYWYNREWPSSERFDQSFQAVLQSEPAGTVEYYSEYLESNRFPGENQSLLLRDYLRQKYADRTIDVVVANTDTPLDFLLKYRNTLFTHAPIVFVATRHPSKEELAAGPGLTGITNDNDYRNTLNLALRLHPGTEQVFVVSGTLDRDKRFETQCREEFRDYESRVSFTYLTDLPPEELVFKTKSLPERSIVLYVYQQFRNDQGNILETRDILALIANSTPVPIYGLSSWKVGRGIVGGYVRTLESNGTRAAQIALRIAKGERAQDIPVENVQVVPIFDWRELKRWGISEDRLPPGSIVSFKEPTIWEQYKWRIIAALALIGVQTLLIAFLLLERRKRELATQKLRKSEEQFRLLFENSRDAILIADDGGHYLQANLAACELLGYSRLQLLQMTVFEMLAADRQDTVARYQSYLQAGYEEGEFSFVRRDEERCTCLYSASRFAPGRHLAILHDITERNRAEQALRESEERLRLAQRAARIGTWEWNLITGEANWSEGIYSLLGLEQGDGSARVKDFIEFIHPEDRERALGTVESVIKDGEYYDNEFRIIRRDGAILWLASTGRVVRGTSGNAELMVGVNIDITERKRAEISLRQALLEVEQLKEQLQAENVYLQEEIKIHHNFDELVGESRELKYVLYKVEQVAPTDTTVLLLGETGTGKELVARAIHRASPRQDRPLVKVNCAALPTNLIESELFGYEKGAFTGASARKIGRFELANEGTLLLDEIGELPLELQGKLLRVLQEGEFERLGGSKTIKINVRVITATNRNLKNEVKTGLFREDLWYRLSVFPISLPPLRQRKEDIPLLVNHFSNTFSKKLGRSLHSVAPGAMKALQDYSWPGNVRELANVIERAVINAKGPVLYLADELDAASPQNGSSSNGRSLIEMEREIILQRLEETHWRIEGPKGAAQSLGLNPSTLRSRMAKLGIQPKKDHR